MTNPFERCAACDTDFEVGTAHFCPAATEGLTATPNIEPTPDKIPGITKDNLLEKSPDIRGKWEFKGEEGFRMMEATADERIVNNVMRHEYKVLTNEEKAQMRKVKDDALAFWELLDSLGGSREIALAKTKIEESVFWSIKHITG